jgi:hypothetical protein
VCFQRFLGAQNVKRTVQSACVVPLLGHISATKI